MRSSCSLLYCPTRKVHGRLSHQRFQGWNCSLIWWIHEIWETKHFQTSVLLSAKQQKFQPSSYIRGHLSGTVPSFFGWRLTLKLTLLRLSSLYWISNLSSPFFTRPDLWSRYVPSRIRWACHTLHSRTDRKWTRRYISINTGCGRGSGDGMESRDVAPDGPRLTFNLFNVFTGRGRSLSDYWSGIADQLKSILHTPRVRHRSDVVFECLHLIHITDM